MEIETRDDISTSDNISLDIDKIEQFLVKKAEALEPLSSNCCIYKVPPRLREPNKEKFTPQIVSIGPYHHGKIEMQPMEEHKFRYLSAFLRRINMSMREYIKGLKELEVHLRGSYVDVTGFNREEFIQIMAVDGAFLMELLLKHYQESWEPNDQIFERHRLYGSVSDDLLLIENQLPFHYLEHLFALFKRSNTDETFTLEDMMKEFIRYRVDNWDLSTINDIATRDREVQHLLHFLIICLQKSQVNERKRCKSASTPTISELHRAGVKFKPSSTYCLSSINFADGILEIPRLKLTDKAEMIFRNMQAFEYCHRLEFYVGDYIFLMDMLVNDGEDVKILVQSGIIDNWLEDNHVAAAVFNNLGKGNAINSSKFSHTQVIEDLNAYYRRKRHKWKATLKQKYFNNPWTIISVIAAAFLLLLTVIQTVCSILQVV